MLRGLLMASLALWWCLQILQLAVLDADVAILDEIDSGGLLSMVQLRMPILKRMLCKNPKGRAERRNLVQPAVTRGSEEQTDDMTPAPSATLTGFTLCANRSGH